MATLKGDRVFWGHDGIESLSCHDPDEAMHEYVNDWCTDGSFPEKVTLAEYVPRKVQIKPEHLSELIIERIWNDVLEDEYGGPEFDNDPPQIVLDKANELATLILKEYSPWQCEETGKTVEYDCLEFIKENYPDILILKESSAR